MWPYANRRPENVGTLGFSPPGEKDLSARRLGIQCRVVQEAAAAHK